MSVLKSSRRHFLKGGISSTGMVVSGIGLGSALSNKSNARVLPDNSAEGIIKTTAGKIRGTMADGVRIYRGIPYGADTGGKNRFLPPQPVKQWDGIRDALEFGNMAPQAGGFAGPGRPPADARITSTLFAPLTQQPQSEDCLYLNVWSKGVGKKANRPVMVWLHGGGFTSGSGASSLYDGINLCRRGDVVVVTINHRLGALAHLHLSPLNKDQYGDKYKNSGMAGMLDAVQALEWVKDNIKEFGGDANNVTIFGESGGGRKVSTLLATPSAKGLFHRAIIQSGPGLRFPTQEIATLRTKILMEELGLTADQTDKLLMIPFEKIAAAQGVAERKTVAQLPESAPFFDRYGWSPVVCDALPHSPFDPEAPQESLDIPVMIGTNRHEMALFISPNKALDTIDMKMLKTQVKPFAGDKADELIATYQKQYPEENLRGILLLMLADDRYRMDSITLAERKSKKKAAPIYMYRFDWETPVWNGLLRASHALEIPFVFNNAQLSDAFTGGGPDAVQLSAVMSDTWMSFARNGNPNNDMIPNWAPYDSEKRSTLLFNDSLKLIDDPGSVERMAWKDIR
ncbi:MAG: carboxylesterase/lipase family protein [Cellvibrionaceae bacterium]